MKKLLSLLFILSFTMTIHAQNDNIAYFKGTKLDDITVNVSNITNNQYVVDITEQIKKKNYIPAPDNCYKGKLIITNDTTQIKKIKKIEVAGMVEANLNKYPISDYEIVLNEWFFYSFNINNGDAIINDTAINKFTNANFTTNGNQLISDDGYVELNDYIYINPESDISIDYDFSYHWNAGNITQNMNFGLLYAINLEDETTYKIDTKVTNGTIDNPISNITPNSDKTINYYPKDGYKLKGIIVDSEMVSINDYPTAYTFKNINNNHTIEVIFEKIIKKADNNTKNNNVKESDSPAKPNLPATGNIKLFSAIILIILANCMVLFNRSLRTH